MQKPKLLTGIQASGRLHIGNYLGALKPFVDTVRDYDATIMVADYHALTSLRDPALLRQNIIEVVKDYLAVGLDPKHVTIFKQSDVLQHTELAWIFDCLVTVPFLELGHAYKDKVAKGLEANAGLFTYPMLMAADILLYDTDVVPVGEDQRQHLEYAREAASKFNNAYGVAFKEPKELINKDIAIIPGTDGKKMSKSYGNTIPLFGTTEEITKAVMGIITDSNAESPTNVYNIHAHFRTREELSVLYRENKGKYKALKDALIADIEAVVAPMRAKRDALTDDDIRRVLAEGGEKARAIAEAKMAEVRKLVGVTI